jgi:hypothetical protein
MNEQQRVGGKNRDARTLAAAPAAPAAPLARNPPAPPRRRRIIALIGMLAPSAVAWQGPK